MSGIPSKSGIPLHNGMVYLPLVGLGTFEMRDEAELRASIRTALASGCRLIDTAQVYRNEAMIGDILWAECEYMGISRSDIFLISKLQTSNHGYHKALESIQQSMLALKTDYIDLFLIHWPGASKIPANSPINASMRRESWRALCEAYNRGWLRSIGVSNYTACHLQEFHSYTSSPEWNSKVEGEGDIICPFIMPMVNQIEVSPVWYPQEDIGYCRQHNIIVQGYSTLGRGGQDILSNGVVLELAQKYEITPAQLCLLWSLQLGIPVIPKSRHPDRVMSNMKVLDLFQGGSDGTSAKIRIEDGDMNRIMTEIPKGKVCWNPSIVA